MERFGHVVEHSPWVAEAVWENDSDKAQDEYFLPLAEAFGRVIRASGKEKQLELLKAHPNLACGVVASEELTRMSREEQESAGLDKCSPEEFIEFQGLNLEYREKFGFPFIIAVKGMDRREILQRFRDRIERSPEREFTTALENVIRIIGFRIEAVMKGHG